MSKFKIFGLFTIVGVGITAVSSAFSMKKSLDALADDANQPTDEIVLEESKKERAKRVFKKVYKYWIPTVAIGTGTIICSAVSMEIGAKEISAATAATYALKRSYERHKDAIKDIFGEEGLRRIELHKAVNESQKSPQKDVLDEEVFWLGYGCDMYIKTTRKKLELAEGFMNKKLRTDHTVSIADFLDYIGVDPPHEATLCGWGRQELYCDLDDGWLEIKTPSMKIDNDEKIEMIEFKTEPDPDFEENDKEYDDVPWYN